MQPHQRRRAGDAGRGEIPQLVAAAGAGRGDLAQPDAGAGGVEVPQAVAAGGDGRDLTPRQVQRNLLVPNINQMPGPSDGKPIERKGIFLALIPEEFEEIVLKKKYITKSKQVNEANQELVKSYNDMRKYRLKSFWRRKNGATNAEMTVLEAGYDRMMAQIKITKEMIEHHKATPVPTPIHLCDKEVIFG